MTSIFFNSSSNNHSPYPSDHFEDHLNHHQFLNPNYQASSSSNSLTTHMFLSSNDQNEVFSSEPHPPPHQHEGDNFGSQPYKDHQTKNNNMKSDLNQVKWMSSKMRVMLKMKKSDHVNPNGYIPTTQEVKNLDDHKHMTSQPIEEAYNSSNSTSPNNNIQIRVCSDCNTTKTPLWRSGPRGPKSLCNACGIRQRKARRAMAAAAIAENNNSNMFINRSMIMPLKVTKPQHKDHKKLHKGQVTKYKKKQYSKQMITRTNITPPVPLSSPSSSSCAVRKNCVEELLVSLRKKLTFYHVFPQDEKEAAILLMALSCGYAHGQS
ncbi:hypothetical protein QVD17_26522 [Tagetes erecta]|uniref:GATA-type domain-containing protein n=1 Tax=Tagetes erecta TaxID=13708 RepID=A0AAD8K6Q5_TARER|nr:hypothetical protein QVD17_26522 [Tagetes erecta]